MTRMIYPVLILLPLSFLFTQGVSPNEGLCSVKKTEYMTGDLRLSTPHFPQWYSVDDCECQVSVQSGSAVIHADIFMQTLSSTTWCMPEVQMGFTGMLTSVCPSPSGNASLQYEMDQGQSINVIVRNSDTIYIRVTIHLTASTGALLKASCGGADIGSGLKPESVHGLSPATQGAQKGAVAAGCVVVILVIIFIVIILIKLKHNQRHNVDDGAKDKLLSKSMELSVSKEYNTILADPGEANEGFDDKSLNRQTLETVEEETELQVLPSISQFCDRKPAASTPGAYANDGFMESPYRPKKTFYDSETYGFSPQPSRLTRTDSSDRQLATLDTTEPPVSYQFIPRHPINLQQAAFPFRGPRGSTQHGPPGARFDCTEPVCGVFGRREYDEGFFSQPLPPQAPLFRVDDSEFDMNSVSDVVQCFK